MFQIGIVGAGPAGSTCARVLGEAGVDVAIFDNSHPREKPCGGFIENRVVEEFKIPATLLENEVKWSLAERFGVRTKFFFERPSFLVSRKDFDQYLLQKALENRNVAFFDEKVAEVSEEKEKWTLRTSKGRNTEVKVLIGADGCPSLIRKHVCKPIPREFLAITAGYNFSCSTEFLDKNFAKNTVEVYYSNRYVKNPGFIWIFPKKTKINIGIGSRGTGSKLKQALDSFIASHPAGKRFKNLEGGFFAHLIPCVWAKDFFDLPCSGSNWALIGDAAGHAYPIDGLGIYYAMKGGMLCGSAFLAGDVHLFDKYWREQYGDELYSAASAFPRIYGSLGFATWIAAVLKNFIAKPRQTAVPTADNINTTKENLFFSNEADN